MLFSIKLMQTVSVHFIYPHVNFTCYYLTPWTSPDSPLSVSCQEDNIISINTPSCAPVSNLKWINVLLAFRVIVHSSSDELLLWRIPQSKQCCHWSPVCCFLHTISQWCNLVHTFSQFMACALFHTICRPRCCSCRTPIISSSNIFFCSVLDSQLCLLLYSALGTWLVWQTLSTLSRVISWCSDDLFQIQSQSPL